MINPSVGLTVVTSSPIILFTMVVLPALSSPLYSVLIPNHRKKEIKIKITALGPAFPCPLDELCVRLTTCCCGGSKGEKSKIGLRRCGLCYRLGAPAPALHAVHPSLHTIRPRSEFQVLRLHCIGGEVACLIILGNG